MEGCKVPAQGFGTLGQQQRCRSHVGLVLHLVVKIDIARNAHGSPRTPALALKTVLLVSGRTKRRSACSPEKTPENGRCATTCQAPTMAGTSVLRGTLCWNNENSWSKSPNGCSRTTRSARPAVRR